MTSLFRSRGFESIESIIGKGTTIHGELRIAAGSTTTIEGNAFLSAARCEMTDGKESSKTTLHVSGLLDQPLAEELNIEVHNVIITGKVVCKTIRVEGTLAIKAGATLKADKILYRELIIETGAVVHGQMFHLDHVSEGEQVGCHEEL